MPTFLTKKEVFPWLLEGKKTIDIRKGKPSRGDTAVFMSGPDILHRRILKKQAGKLMEIVTSDNYMQVIPWEKNLGDALAYLKALYPTYDGVFTAYYLDGKEG